VDATPTTPSTKRWIEAKDGARTALGPARQTQVVVLIYRAVPAEA